MRLHVHSLAAPSLALILIVGTSNAARPNHDSTVILWPEGAPKAKGHDPTDIPALTIHWPEKQEATGAAVIVNPGGGYRILASDHEGLQVARWLNSIGVAAFVLRYRLNPKYPPSVSLLDAQRAIRHVRYHASDYGIDPDPRVPERGFELTVRRMGRHGQNGFSVPSPPKTRTD